MRVGLLGAARIAPHVIIGPARRRGDVEMVAVAARDPARARLFAEEHSIAEVEGSYEALTERDDLDLVYVALPNSEHAAWSVRAVGRGRAVLCEKPFAVSARQAKAMVAAGEAARRPLLEAFHYRHHELIRAVSDIVRGGELGPLLSVEAFFVAELPRDDGVRWSAELGGGALLDLGCYCVHALRTILGEEPVVRSATARIEKGVDAELHGELAFLGCPTARVSCSMAAGRRAAGLVFRGERGELLVDNFVAPQLPHSVTVRTARGERQLTFPGPGTFDQQLAHAIAVVRDGAEALTGGEDAIANMKVIDALHTAAGRTVAIAELAGGAVGQG